MEAVVEWMDMECEVGFSPPLFDLPDCDAAVLKSLCESLSVLFPIRSDDMHVSRGSQLSDAAVRIAMVRGHARLDLTADEFVMNLDRLPREGGVAIWRDCVSLGEQALERVFPNLSVGLVTIEPTLHLRLVDGEPTARDYLHQVAGSGIGGDLSGTTGTMMYPCVHCEVENESEGWEATFSVYPSRENKASLIVSCRTLYHENASIRGLGRRSARLCALLTALLAEVGLQVSIDVPQSEDQGNGRPKK